MFDQDSNSIAAHVFSSCRFKTNHSFLESQGISTNPGKIIFKNTHFSKLSAVTSPYFFEQRNGNSNICDLMFENCIIENYFSSSASLQHAFRRVNVSLKSTIIIDYSNNSSGLITAGTAELQGANCIMREDGTDLYPNESNLAVNPLFVSPASDNWNLRPSSTLIGQGK